MTKYEQLIECVTNGEEGKAAELFHEIVVSKSRDIYESLMDSENEFGGDQADELINDISSDEEGMRVDGEENEMPAEFGGEEIDDMDDDDTDGEFGAEEGEADLEDRVVDLEDQLDVLMAEFDSVMAGEEGTEPEMGEEEEELDMQGQFNEAVKLEKVSKGIATSTEEEGTNKQSVNADNSGKKGAVAKPITPTGTEANGQSNPEVKPGNGTTAPNESKVKEPKKSGEDSGVNKKSLSGS